MDDFHTYGAVPVTVTEHGCAGEFCAGLGVDAHPCAACRAGTVNTSIVMRGAGQ